MKRLFYLIALIFLPIAWGYAQQTFSSQENYYEDSKGIVYDQEFTVDFKFHTHGFALGFNKGKIISYHRTRFFDIEIGELKHPKEYRQSFDFQSPTTTKVSRAFIFGKQNNLYALRAGVGEKRYFSEKAKRRGLAIGLSYEAGPTLGLLKPYYLELVGNTTDGDPNNVVIRSEKYSPENEARFLDINRIYGSSGFSKGLGEISVLPGAHAELAVHFDWGAFDEFVKAAEAGIMVDLFFRKAPIMVEGSGTGVTNLPIFANLYLNLQLGKRW